MKIANITKVLFTTLALSLFTTASFSQASPEATAVGTIYGANLSIKYNSPSVKGRKIYGTDLVPYGGKVWRAGANKATTFETDKDITVEGKKLPAGKYSLYVIANENEWVFIFNSKTGQWGINRDGSTTLDPTADVIRVTVKPRKAAFRESLVYQFNPDGFILGWENIEVPVGIK
ncbi:DUF2911 domain-containing protein [Sediminibacterium roseum]|uniref:DUF2911 domain-containing protein n=1 Tax=Sediminibacterium roseum TaxID=1978412 RepID=A0ABW9ZUN6_9BACT|nr:DUF2911 domain-containing protein [Sediminibacterium roseum]NCI50849.1 DUF2911 domain-containing protein [Sediminibacterium roseum]